MKKLLFMILLIASAQLINSGAAPQSARQDGPLPVAHFITQGFGDFTGYRQVPQVEPLRRRAARGSSEAASSADGLSTPYNVGYQPETEHVSRAAGSASY